MWPLAFGLCFALPDQCLRCNGLSRLPFSSLSLENGFGFAPMRVAAAINIRLNLLYAEAGLLVMLALHIIACLDPCPSAASYRPCTSSRTTFPSLPRQKRAEKDAEQAKSRQAHVAAQLEQRQSLLVPERADSVIDTVARTGHRLDVNSPLPSLGGKK